MRILTDHITNVANDLIKIEVMGEPGPGGANHLYRARWTPKVTDPQSFPRNSLQIAFQNGAIAETGVNGITHEALLAILIDRLRSFQEGPYNCRENALALTKMEEALMWLHKRTMGRMKRGVEGTMAV